MEHIAGCKDDEGTLFFEQALCRVYNGGAEKDGTLSHDVDGNPKSPAMEEYVDIVAARRRTSRDTGETYVKPLKSSEVKYPTGVTVASTLKEPSSRQRDGAAGSCSGGGSLLSKSLHAAAEDSSRSSLPGKGHDDSTMVELIEQFERIIDEARQRSTKSSTDSAPVASVPTDRSSSIGERNQDKAPAAGGGDDKDKPDKPLQSYADMVFAVRGEGSRLFDVDETPSCTAHYQPSSLSPYMESANAILEEQHGRLHKR